jgi:hypothetical protein
MTDQIVCMYIGLGAFCFCALVTGLAIYIYTLWSIGEYEFVGFWVMSLLIALTITFLIYF